MRMGRLHFERTMTSTCPDCGEAIEYTDRSVRLRTGSCGACKHEFTFVEGIALSVPGAAEMPSGAAAAEAAAPPEGTPECAECGQPLAFRAQSDGSIEARCDECETTAVYVAQGGEEEAEERPARGGPRGRPRGGPEDRESPRSRPCRQCGAPLRFTTNEEGSLVGECDACGNRFVLPPRRDFGPGGGRFGPGGRSRTGGRYGPPRSGSSWGRSGGRPERGGRGRAGGYGSRDGDDRRRRRRRTDDE